MPQSRSPGVEFETSTSTMMSQDTDGDENKVRGNWTGKLDFILSCLGFAVGLGNVWRFPYLAYIHGGAIFLIPYALSLFLIGIPIFFLELSVGQFTSSGPLTCWKMAPMFQGIGAAMLVVSSILAIYYNVIIAWAIYYLIASFTALPSVPWKNCDPAWATPYCFNYVAKINGTLECSQFEGYNSTNSSGKYLPFPNGLCIGLKEEQIKSDWLENAVPTLSNDSFHYHLEHKRFKTEYTVANNTPFEAEWVANLTSKPFKDSNFTSGLLGFWDEERAKNNSFKRTSASEEYFTRRVLRRHLSEGMSDLGEVHWDLTLCLLAGWIIVFLCLIKGIKSSGKVVYFTALFPYLVLIILAVRGALMNGSLNGVMFYLRGYGCDPRARPDDLSEFYLKRLSNPEVWQAAATQIFFSLSACYGGLITLASYNKFNTNVVRDTLIVTFGNCLTSFFAGFVIFSFLGALALKTNVDVEEVAQSGIGLAFIVYPEAVTHIPPAPLWAILFFIMLLTLGLDSEFALMETLLTSVIDVMPKLRPYKTIVIAVLCTTFFLFGLTMCTSGGVLMLTLLDTFGAGWNVLVIAILECVAVAWIYCIVPAIRKDQSFMTRFVDDIQTMLGTETVLFCVPWKYFRWFWMFMWAFITPLLCVILMILSLVDYAKKEVKLADGDYVFETEYIVLGWMITALVVVVFIVGAVLAVREHGLFGSFCPSRFWGPALPQHRRLCTHHDDMDDDPWNKDYEMEQGNMAYAESSEKF